MHHDKRTKSHSDQALGRYHYVASPTGYRFDIDKVLLRVLFCITLAKYLTIVMISHKNTRFYILFQSKENLTITLKVQFI